MSPTAPVNPHAPHPFPRLSFDQAFERASRRSGLEVDVAAGRVPMRQLTPCGPLPAHAKVPLRWIEADGQPLLAALADLVGRSAPELWRIDPDGRVFSLPEVAEAYWLHCSPWDLLVAIQNNWAVQSAVEREDVERSFGRPYEELVEGPEPMGM